MVFAFRGDRSTAFDADFRSKLKAEKDGTEPGPTVEECLLYAGHTGVSTDAGSTVYGFNPDGSGMPTWKLIDDLKNGDSFPGIVKDDTAVFAKAKGLGLPSWSFEVLLPDPHFTHFGTTLSAEITKSKYSYGYPNGHGDCNCTTWLERLGLPLLSGRMIEFTGLLAKAPHTRRFGCT